MNWLDHMRDTCESINALRRALSAAERRTADSIRATAYVDEAKALIEIAYELLQVDRRLAKRAPPPPARRPSAEPLH
jgi:hypothetical protein